MEDKNINKIVIYKTEDGQTKIDVSIDGDTIWLTQKQTAELFNVDVRTINEHLINIFKSGELDDISAIRKFRITAEDNKQYNVNHYNLDAVISLGYRVNSLRATEFRIWATKRLKEYIIKGFAIDDDRLKQNSKKNRYFEELLERIRDIRSSERNFYQKVTDIFTTSIDYDPKNNLAREFFATIQNKIHFAVHGKTAAEVIYDRADSSKQLMGVTNFSGSYLTKSDIKNAKNYLNEKELKQLNIIVSLYLDFGELQASNQIPMKMNDWITKLDDFLKLAGKSILTSKGKISHEVAVKRAENEYDEFKQSKMNNMESDFDKFVKKLNSKK
ncbi:MAG: virulence RhuM family protein [bacterium]